MIGVISHESNFLELTEIKMEGNIVVDHMNTFPLADKYSLLGFDGIISPVRINVRVPSSNAYTLQPLQNRQFSSPALNNRAAI